MSSLAKNTMGNWRKGMVNLAAVLACGFLLVQVHGASAQSRPRNNNAPLPGLGTNTDPLDFPDVYGGDDPIKQKAEERRVAAMNADRQKALIADTNRLVKLAADLNAQVNSEHRSVLTPDEARQFAEIEKLAHGIRDKMSATFNAPAVGSGLNGSIFAPQ